MSNDTSLESKLRLKADKTIALDSVSVDGDITAHVNNGVTLNLSNVDYISESALNSIVEQFPDELMYSDGPYGYDIALIAESSSIESSLMIVKDVLEVISAESPILHKELYELMRDITPDDILESDGFILPHYMIRVKDDELGEKVFYRTGWVDNTVPFFSELYGIENSANDFKRGNKQPLFNPFKYGYTDTQISNLCDDAILLQVRAEALTAESKDALPYDSIESLCSSYEDLERTKIIVKDIIDHENEEALNHDVALHIREDYTDSVLKQIATIKLLAVKFPAYDLAENLVGILRQEIVDTISESRLIYDQSRKKEEDLDQETSPESTYTGGFTSMSTSPYTDVPESIPNMRENLKQADYEIMDLMKNRCLHENLPELTDNIFVFKPSPIMDEHNYTSRLKLYKNAIERKSSELRDSENSNNSNTDDIASQLDNLENGLSEMIEFIDSMHSDPLIFKYDMPIRFLEEARNHAGDLYNKEPRNSINTACNLIARKD